MSNQHSTKFILYGLLTVILLVFIMARGAWLNYFSESSRPGPETASITQTTSAPEQAEDLAGEEAVQEPVVSSKGAAKRIVKVSGQAVEASERDVDTEVQELVKEMLESALTGDFEQAVTVSNLMRNCSNEYGEDQVRSHIADFKKIKFTSEILMQFGNGQEVSFQNLEAFESYLWKMHDKCRAVKGLLEDDLRERIKLLADNGLVTARYIFALWPPSQTGVVSDDTLKTLEYQNDALDYTWRNVDEREVLGLLAFAQSYSQASGIFTPSNYMQGIHFLIAAKKCGLNSPWLEAEIKTKLDRMMRFGNKLNLELIEFNAGEIRKLFCD